MCPSGNSILVNLPNEKTNVSISKKAVSGEDELYGAELKINRSSNHAPKELLISRGLRTFPLNVNTPIMTHFMWGLETSSLIYLVESNIFCN